MDNERFIRTAMLLGEENLTKLKQSSVIVFGAGGVGSYVIEALARAGVGRLTIVDNDRVDISNINRQIIALSSTIGQYKAQAAKERVLDINPCCKAESRQVFVTPENLGDFRLEDYDGVVDAIDNVTAKLAVAEYCYNSGTPVISSMGTGNKTDPTRFRLGDIYETSVCPLARVMRYELRKRKVPFLRVLFSLEKPMRNVQPPSSVSYVPSVGGLLIAADLINNVLLRQYTA